MRTQTEKLLAEYHWQDNYHNGSPQNGSSSMEYQSRYFQRSDVKVNPMVNGWRAPSPYSSDEWVVQYAEYRSAIDWLPCWGGGMWNYKLTGRVHTGHCYFASENIQPQWREPVERHWDPLYFMALKQAKDQAINLAITLATVNQTIDLVSGNLRKIATAMMQARTRDWDGLLRTLGIRYNWRASSRDIAGRWLEVAFGWSPLLSDIYGAIDEVGRTNQETGFTIVSRATNRLVEEVVDVSYKGQWRNVISNAAYYAVGQGKVTRQESYRVNLWFEVDSPALKRASALGLTNPAEVLWDLTPWSFVLDWVVPIGDWIRSLDAGFGLNLKAATGTWRRVEDLRLERFHSAEANEPCKTYQFSGSGGRNAVHQTRRVVLSKSPSPFYLKNPFDTWKAITAVALVRQQKL